MGEVEDAHRHKFSIDTVEHVVAASEPWEDALVLEGS